MARSGLRGGGSWSEESMEKEDYYQKAKPKKKNKKKLCKLHNLAYAWL